MIRKLVFGVIIIYIILFLYILFKIRNKNSRTLIKKNILSVLPECGFFIMTFFIFMPSSLFLLNSKEFSIGYFKIIPIISFLSIACLIGLCLVIMALKGKRLVQIVSTLIFSIALCFYLQGNFLNPKLPELNGVQIVWNEFKIHGIISILVWLVVIVGMQIIMHFFTDKTIKVMKCASFFMSAVMFVTLVTLLLTTPKPNASDISLTKEDEFCVGTDKNVIIFVLDSMGADKFEEILNKEADLQASLADFTFFNNVVSGGAYTSVGIPMLLTGSEFDPIWQRYEVYLNQAWLDTSLYKDLKEENYDIRLYTDSRYVTNVSSELISNVVAVGEGYRITNKLKFAKALYQFSCFYSMPQFAKQLFWMNGDDLTSQIEPVYASDSDKTGVGEDDLNVKTHDNHYSFDDDLFYRDLKQNGLSDSYQNAYRVYHLNGAHAPYILTRDGENAVSGETSEEEQITGCMKIVNDYIQNLKDKGLYDQSMIVITADHGRAGRESGIQQNPTVLIKQPQEKHELQVMSQPVHFRNIIATIAKNVFEDYSAYGPSVYDIDENSDVERLHTVASPVCGDWFPDIAEEHSFARFIIPEKLMDNEHITYYNPEEINRFTYTVGSTIDFKNANVPKEMNYRIYKENGTGIFSNEFAMYLDLTDYTGSDLWLKLKCSKIYNNNQKMRLYIKGERIAEITCSTEDIGKEMAVLIPKDAIKDNALPIRMVFPNAVTPKQIGEGEDTRVLSIAVESIKIENK